MQLNKAKKDLVLERVHLLQNTLNYYKILHETRKYRKDGKILL